MAAVRGKDFKLYLGGEDPYDADTPTWVEMTNIKDVTRNLEKATADVSVRGSSFRMEVGTLKGLSIDLQSVYDPTDANLAVFEQAFYDDANILLLALDGSINTVGSRGIRLSAQVTKYTGNEALEDAGLIDITVVPGYDPDDLPRRVHVAVAGAVIDS